MSVNFKMVFRRMMHVLFVFIFLATISESQGQTTQSSGLPIPNTDCGQRTLKCWTDRQPSIEKANNDYYYSLACQYYKSYVDCYSKLITDPSCKNESEVTSIVAEIAQDQGGLCFDDGGVKPCGVELQTCLTDVLLIEDAFKKKNATMACPALTKFMSCAESTRNRGDCPPNLRDALNKLEASMNQDQMMSGCVGNCSLLIGKCTGNLTFDLVSKDVISMDWKQFCSDAYAALFCIDALSTNPVCKGNDLVNSVSNGQKLVIGDYCVGDAKPSPCIQRLKECTDGWRKVDSSGTYAQQCEVTATLLDCTTRLSCSADVNQILMSLRNQIDSQETKRHCPTVGTCSTRLSTCATWQDDVNRDKNSSQYCSFVTSGYDCYNYVRRDQICVRENLTVSDFEKQITNLNSGSLYRQCGGGGAGPRGQFSMFLLLIAAVVALIFIHLV